MKTRLLLVALLAVGAACSKKKSAPATGGGPAPTKVRDYSGKWSFFHNYTSVCPGAQTAPSSNPSAVKPQHAGFHYMGDFTVDPVTGDWSAIPGEHGIVGHTDLKTGAVTYTTNDNPCGLGHATGSCPTDQYCEGTFNHDGTPYGGTFQLWR